MENVSAPRPLVRLHIVCPVEPVRHLSLAGFNFLISCGRVAAIVALAGVRK